MSKLNDIIEEEKKYIRKELRNNGGIIEADEAVNGFSGSIIDEFLKENERGFLGKYFYRGKEVELTECFIDTEVLNFSCDFIVPVVDEKLLELLFELDVRQNMEGIERVQERVEEIGGELLIWS